MQGDLHGSFALYPPAIPLLLYIAYTIADRIFKFDTKKEVVKKTMFIIVGAIMMVSYGVKLYHYYLIYKTSA